MTSYHPFVVGFACGVILMAIGVLWLENEHRKDIRILITQFTDT